MFNATAREIFSIFLLSLGVTVQKVACLFVCLIDFFVLTYG